MDAVILCSPPVRRVLIDLFSLSSQNVPVDDRRLLHQRPSPEPPTPSAFIASTPSLIIIIASP